MEPKTSQLNSTLVGFLVVAAAVVLAPLFVAALFWTCGVAGRAFHWMVAGF